MRKLKINSQLSYLFLGNLTILFVGMGLFPVLPLYAAKFGADRGVIGLFFGSIYAALTAGSLVLGWLANRMERRKLFILIGLVGMPPLVLLGFASQLWQVFVLTAVVWFCGGVNLALINLLIGLQTQGSNRGRSFSLVSLSIPFGSLIGATTVGTLVSRAGYPVMFMVLGAVWLVLPLLGLVAINFPQSTGIQSAQRNTRASTDLGGKRYALLLGVAILSATAINTGRLGMSLSMQSLEFSPQAIAGAATISGLVTIPLTILIGALSDRLGSRHSLWLVYLLTSGGGIVLSGAAQLWQFWLAASLTTLAFCTNGAMTSALAADLLPPTSLTRGLPWVNTAISAGAIVSFLGTGYLMDLLEPRSVFLIASTLPIIAAGVVQLLPARSLASDTSDVQLEADCDPGKSPVPAVGGCM